jgi:hypothetical protein
MLIGSRMFPSSAFADTLLRIVGGVRSGLCLTDSLLAQLQPFMAGQEIIAIQHSHLADQQISAHCHVACVASA